MTRSKWSIIMHCDARELPAADRPALRDLLAKALHTGVTALKDRQNAADAARQCLCTLEQNTALAGSLQACIVHDRDGRTRAAARDSARVIECGGGLAFCAFAETAPAAGASLAPTQPELEAFVAAQKALGREGGLIALDAQGRPAWAHSGSLFPVAYQSNNMSAPAVHLSSAESKTRLRRARKTTPAAQIDIADPFDTWGWSRKLKITPDQLRRIVQDVGPSASAVIPAAKKAARAR